MPAPAIAQAVAWLAELRGWTNTCPGKPPGATVLDGGARRRGQGAVQHRQSHGRRARHRGRLLRRHDPRIEHVRDAHSGRRSGRRRARQGRRNRRRGRERHRRRHQRHGHLIAGGLRLSRGGELHFVRFARRAERSGRPRCAAIAPSRSAAERERLSAAPPPHVGGSRRSRSRSRRRGRDPIVIPSGTRGCARWS